MAKKRRGRGEGSLSYKPSKEVWVGRVIVGREPNGKVRYKEVTGQTKGECMARMRAVENEARSGWLVTADDQPPLLSDWLEHWLTTAVRPVQADSTYRSYERCVRLHIVPKLGGHRIRDIRPVHVQNFLSSAVSSEDLTPGNARKVHEVLSAAFGHAVRLQMLGANPCSAVRKPRVVQEPIEVFTDDEVKAVLTAAQRHRLFSLIALAFGTGARQGELLALHWPDVDLVRGTIHITKTLDQTKDRGFFLKEPKSSRGTRVIDVPQFAMAALADRRAVVENEGTVDGPVFASLRHGGYVGKTALLQGCWTPTLERAGVPYRKFHAARHTHATRLLMDGTPLAVVAHRLGDQQQTIVRVYSHYLAGSGSAIAARIDGYYTRTTVQEIDKGELRGKSGKTGTQADEEE